jgi:hypothetical protein
MLAVPVSLSQVFEAQLVQRNVPDQHRRDFQNGFGFIWISATSMVQTQISQQALPHLTKSCKAKTSLKANGNKLAGP